MRTRQTRTMTIENTRTVGASNFIISPSTFVLENSLNFSDVYRMGNCIGRGAYGEVRTCYHRETDIKRAVKIFRKDLRQKESFKLHITQEIEILKTLDHPNIVRVFEYFEDSNRIYIVMEHISGGELFDEIIKSKTFCETNAAQIMHQLFSIVHYLHEHNIIHKDLKPENILLEEKHNLMNIKLVDFGTATTIEPVKQSRYLQGTAYYMAPEIVFGSYNEKCDI